MTPTQVELNALQTLMAADTTTLANATALKLHLLSAPFTPGPGTDLGSLTEATFDGYAAKTAGTGTQQAFRDPITGQLTVQMLEPAGGWHFQCNGATALPQTIYGYCLTNGAGSVTYGSALLPTPIVITASGDAVDIAQVRFEFAPPVLV
jgi:phage-related tail fiber protein